MLAWLLNLDFAASNVEEPEAEVITSYYTVYSRVRLIETISMARSVSIHSTAQPIVVYSK